MAHLMLEKMLAERGITGIKVRSGGIAIYARDGMIASLDAYFMLQEENVHIEREKFVSTDLKKHRDLISNANLILTMTDEQKVMLEAFREAVDKPTYTLKEFSGEKGDIEDPAMQGEEAFRARMVEIKRCLKQSLDALIVRSEQVQCPTSAPSLILAMT